MDAGFFDIMVDCLFEDATSISRMFVLAITADFIDAL